MYHIWRTMRLKCYTMFEAINSCQTEMNTDKMRLAPYCSIQIDETINITLQKTALVFVHILDSRYDLCRLHWKLLPLQSETAALITNTIVESFIK